MQVSPYSSSLRKYSNKLRNVESQKNVQKDPECRAVVEAYKAFWCEPTMDSSSNSIRMSSREWGKCDLPRMLQQGQLIWERSPF